jgi:hypothetical protein
MKNQREWGIKVRVRSQVGGPGRPARPLAHATCIRGHPRTLLRGGGSASLAPHEVHPRIPARVNPAVVCSQLDPRPCKAGARPKPVLQDNQSPHDPHLKAQHAGPRGQPFAATARWKIGPPLPCPASTLPPHPPATCPVVADTADTTAPELLKAGRLHLLGQGRLRGALFHGQRVWCGDLDSKEWGPRSRVEPWANACRLSLVGTGAALVHPKAASPTSITASSCLTACAGRQSRGAIPLSPLHRCKLLRRSSLHTTLVLWPATHQAHHPCQPCILPDWFRAQGAASSAAGDVSPRVPAARKITHRESGRGRLQRGGTSAAALFALIREPGVPDRWGRGGQPALEPPG